VSFVLGADFAVAVLLFLLILQRKEGPAADRWLLVVLGCLAFIALVQGLCLAGVVPGWAVPLALFAGGSGFLIPPAALYLYVREVAGTYRQTDLFCFLPALIHLAWLQFETLAGRGVYFVSGFVGVDASAYGAAWWLAAASILITLIFPVLGLREIARLRTRLRQGLARLEGRELRWAQYVLWSFIGGGAGGALLVSLALGLTGLDTHAAFAGVMVLAGLVAATIGICGLRQAPVPVADWPVDAPGETVTGSEADMAVLHTVMRSECLHLNDDLRVGDLAASVGWPVARVSRVLRDGGTHFFDFVNAYRVEEARRLLSDPLLYRVSILAIAHDAGFGSKTSFNRIFKTMTGDTPTAYRRRHRQEPG